MTTVVAVSGCNGFVGRHLVAALRPASDRIVGLGREPAPAAETDEHLDEYVHVDLTREWPRMVGVTGIVHLAGRSNVAESFKEPQRFITENSAAVTNLGERLLALPHPPRTLVISSGAVYDPRQPMPIRESGTTFGSSPYAVSKLLVENQSAYYSARGLPFVVVRPFNHIGPGQQRGYLLPDLVHSARQALQQGHAIRVGDLTKVRDYTDVRDVVRAYVLLLTAELGTRTVFNVCSGTGRSGSEMLTAALRALGMVDTPVEVDEERLRPTDPERVVGDNGVLRRVTGWTPEFDLERTVSDFVHSAG